MLFFGLKCFVELEMFIIVVSVFVGGVVSMSSLYKYVKKDLRLSVWYICEVVIRIVIYILRMVLVLKGKRRKIDLEVSIIVVKLWSFKSEILWKLIIWCYCYKELGLC